MFGKDRIKGASKFFTIALLVGGMFISQSCSAEDKKTKVFLRYLVYKLNERLKRFHEARIDYTKWFLKKERRVNAFQMSKVDAVNDLCHYMSIVAEVPKLIIKYKQKIDFYDSNSWLIAEKFEVVDSEKLELMAKKCLLYNNSEKDCNASFFHVLSSFGKDENYVKELFDKIKKNMEKKD